MSERASEAPPVSNIAASLTNGDPVRSDTGHCIITERERHGRFQFRQPRQVVRSASIKNNKVDGTKGREKTVHLHVGKVGKFHFLGMYNLQQHTRLEYTKRLEVEVNRVQVEQTQKHTTAIADNKTSQALTRRDVCP